jgi:signal peptidase I
MIRWLLSKTIRDACAARKHYCRLLAAQHDLLPTSAIAAVELKLDELGAAIKDGSKGGINLKAEELQFAAEKNLKPYPHAAWRENVEVLLVALAVAMGIRTFFLQPFKIPTGSMQPTLFGINSTPDFSSAVRAYDYYSGTGFSDDAKSRLQAEVDRQSQLQKSLVIPSGWERVKEWFQGISYVHVVAPADGTVQVGPITHFLIFNIKQSLSIGGVVTTMWFPPDCGESDLQHRAGLFPERVYRKGDDVVKLRVSAGDHLFVDRLSYNFRKPTRGDIIVFETAGIPENMRNLYRIPSDEFYIKRLVGLGGEKVQIGDDRHLIINGQRLDASTPHFENVYGFDPKQPPRESQYSGHVNGTVARAYNISTLGDLPEFPDQQTVYDVPPGDCLPMGDNTCNSLDSRFWGAIPEQYVIGKSFFVYWPLTSRFGLDNH